jgi:hypothetical protein
MPNPPIRRSDSRTEPRIDPDPEQEWTVSTTDGRGQSTPRPASRRSPMLWMLLLIVLVAGAALFYLWRHNAPALPVVTAPPATPPVAAEATPAIRHPIEDAQGATPSAAEAKPLPALMTSDTTMQNTLADLFGAASLGKVFYEDAIIHRFVTTIDNLPRKSVPARNLPVKPLAGPLVASSRDANVSIAADNAQRYTPYVQMAEAIDSKKLVSAYVHFYPLLQQDYRDLGYPKAYFNDRLIEAIDDLLAAPEPGDPPQLVQPKILYQYADPDLEGLSAGQKTMIRMGSQNEAKIKAKLRELRGELTGARVTNPAPTKQAQ